MDDFAPPKAIDGKTSRRSHDRKAGRLPLHLVSAFATNSRLVLGQEAVDVKSNEITATPALLERLDLKGALVSVDAIGCNPTIAEAVVEAGADDLLAVKDKQPTLHAEIESYFETAPQSEIATTQTLDKAHGRLEIRTHKVSKVIDWVSDVRAFPGAKRFKNLAVIAVVQTRVERGDKVSMERRSSICSRQLSPEDIANAVRSHPKLPKGGTSRLHAFAAGDLADLVTNAICVLEPSDDGGPWLSRPRVGAPRRPIPGYPFRSEVTMDLRTEGNTVTAITWPGGEPVRADVLSFVQDEEHDEPCSLSLIGSGSCRSKRAVVFVSAPHGFTATTAALSAVEPIWSGGGRLLFRIEETAHVGSKDTNLFYRIEPKSDRDEAERLTVHGVELRGARTRDDEPVFAGAPTILTKSHNVSTRSLDGVAWRRAGEREWRDIRREALPNGTIEIIWRDSASKAVRDRLRIAILPEGTALRRLAAGAPWRSGRGELRGGRGPRDRTRGRAVDRARQPGPRSAAREPGRHRVLEHDSFRRNRSRR